MNTNAITFDTQSDIVVVDQNSEMADYDNPRGEVYGFAAYVRASNEHGDTRLLYVGTSRDEREVLAKADKLAAALTARLANLGKLPVAFDSWQPGRPVYGSDAYVEYGQYDDLALEARELADEAFA